MCLLFRLKRNFFEYRKVQQHTTQFQVMPFNFEKYQNMVGEFSNMRLSRNPWFFLGNVPQGIMLTREKWYQERSHFFEREFTKMGSNDDTFLMTFRKYD